jgi:hypothetical protein
MLENTKEAVKIGQSRKAGKQFMLSMHVGQSYAYPISTKQKKV